MINKMQQVVIVGRKRDNKAIIAALQDAGVLHIVPVTEGPLPTGALTGADAEARKASERLLARAESTLAELGAYRTQSVPTPSQEEWERVVEAAAAPASDLAARLTALRADLDAQATYGDVTRTLAGLASGLDRSRRLALVPFVLARGDNPAEVRAALDGDLSGRYELDSRGVTSGAAAVTAGLVAVLREDRDKARAALGKARVGELRLPGRFDGLPLSQAAAEFDRLGRAGRDELTALESARRDLAAQHGPALFAVRDALADEVSVYDVQTLAARGKYSLALQGFVPEDRVPDLRAALDKFGDAVSYELGAAPDHHAEHVPVQLRNNGFVRNFELLLGISAPPRYGTFDPSWVVALFFPFYFGFVIADIGFGLLFLLLGLWMTARARRGEGFNLGFMGTYLDPRTLGQVGFVVNTMSAWAILWGFLTGEIFGTLGEHLHLFYVNNAEWIAEHGRGLIPILFPRIEASFAGTALLFTIAFGILQVLWSWGLRAQLARKHGDNHHFWEAVGMLGGLVALIMLAYGSQVGSNLGGAFTNFSSPVTLVMYLGFAIFILGLVLSKVPLMLIELLSQGGNIISFTRLFAVGLAAAILAGLATDLGWSLAQSLGFIGVILGIVIAAIVHVLALALTIIGHVLQPLRLQYVEFLNPTGYYNETGPRYNPFRRLSPAGSKK